MADMDLWISDSMITNFADDTQSVVIKSKKVEAVESANKRSKQCD